MPRLGVYHRAHRGLSVRSAGAAECVRADDRDGSNSDNNRDILRKAQAQGRKEI